MAELLLAHGADATRVGVGRWVLHPELAPLLASHGATIDSSGSWIGASCTGNQGRKDDPDYVRALLRHGARATDRRSGDYLKGATGVRALNATALHYAARAGFVRTIEVLIEHGADPAAQDSRGRTPLDWLDQAAPSVSRAAVLAHPKETRTRTEFDLALCIDGSCPRIARIARFSPLSCAVMSLTSRFPRLAAACRR
jgi:Ankyrin repeats (3 copies)